MPPLAAVALAGASLLLGAWGPPGGRRAPSALATTALDAPRAQAAVARLDPPCARWVEAELRAGQIRGAGCQEARRRATARIPGRRGVRFGVVERVHLDLARARWVLAVADRCARWPLRGPGKSTLTPAAAEAAGCRVRRVAMSVRVTVHRADDEPSSNTLTLRADPEGVAELPLARARELAEDTRAGTWLAIGAGGWAGRVDLARWDALRTRAHLAWVARGWGAPHLFVTLHPSVPGSAAARALALEAALARQERDYLAVSRGQLQPDLFLRVHLWSPYRDSVLALAGWPDRRAHGAAPSP